MNTNQLDELRDALRSDAQHIQPVGLGADVVQRRGRRRRHRGRAVVAAGSAACLAGVGVAVVSRNQPADQVAVGAAAPGAGSAPELEFRVVDGEVGFSSGHYTNGDGVTYVLSTAPGAARVNDQSQSIYKTSDGENWSSAAQGTSWISDLTERDGVLYAIGTAPGTSAADVQYRLGTSRDDGGTWSDSDLPFDLSPPSATVPISRSASVQVARGANATVALLSEQFWPDLDHDPAAQFARDGAKVVMRISDNGYEAVDLSDCLIEKQRGDRIARGVSPAGLPPEKCADPPVLGTVTWSELGLRGRSDLSRQQLLVSTGGAHWDTVIAPGEGNVRDLVATPDGFLLLESNEVTDPGQVPGSTLWRSTDAQTWTPVATPAGLDVQATNGERVIGIDAGGNVQTSNDGGTTWNATDVSSRLPDGTPASRAFTVDAGPLGFAVVTGLVEPAADAPQRAALLFSTDGVNWRTVTLADEGAPAGTTPVGVTVGADHIAVDYFEVTPVTPGGPRKAVTLLATPRR